jgi:hypothetical protein
MKCPVCTYLTADDWQNVGMIAGSGKDFSSLSVDWMRCANDQCQQTIVRMREVQFAVIDGQPTSSPTEWIARPRGGARPVDPLVPEPLRTDYLEAAAILDLSPRMSAVLAHRVLADLLAKYANRDEYELASRIEQFTADPAHPQRLRENLQHLRQSGDFGPHSPAADSGSDDQVHVHDVGRAEAEWTLDLLDRLFDYLIVDPAHDEKMRASVETLIKQAEGTAGPGD